MTPTMTATPPAKAGRREWIGLSVLALACLLYVMDLTVLHLAVPSISADLKPSSAQLLWIIDIYGFMVAGFLVTMGTLGDRIGRRKLLMIGAAAFGVVSLMAAFSTTPEMLIISRALLGIAGATLAPSTLSLIFSMFKDPGERSRAIAVWISAFSAGSAIGPVLGGVLLESFWWGSVFLLALPVMALLLVLGPIVLPEYKDENASRLDLRSAAMSLVAVLTIIFGLKQIAQDGIAAMPVASIVAGLVVGVLFVRRQLTLTDPMIDVRLFRIPSFSAALVVNFMAIFVAVGYFLFVAQYLQLVVGLSPLQAGLWSLPSAIGVHRRLERRAADRAPGPAGLRHGRRARRRGRRPGGPDRRRRLERAAVRHRRFHHHLPRPGAGLRPHDRADRRVRAAGARGCRLGHLRDRRRARWRAGHLDPGQHRRRDLSRRGRSPADRHPGRGCGRGSRHARRRRGGCPGPPRPARHGPARPSPRTPSSAACRSRPGSASSSRSGWRSWRSSSFATSRPVQAGTTPSSPRPRPRAWRPTTPGVSPRPSVGIGSAVPDC